MIKYDWDMSDGQFAKRHRLPLAIVRTHHQAIADAMAGVIAADKATRDAKQATLDRVAGTACAAMGISAWSEFCDLRLDSDLNRRGIAAAYRAKQAA